MKTLSVLYQEKMAAGDLIPDPAQEQAVVLLDTLREKLLSYDPRPRLFRKRPAAPKGLYFYGDVGRGKTMAMDLFFDSVPIDKKRRVHFHAFMLEVHDFLHMRRNARKEQQKDERIDSDLLLCADHIASDTWLLCFDEFHVKDVADAMILGRLFTALFDRGVVVVMTSNTAPDDLYADGLQRDRFLPFIALLKERLTVYSFNGDKDYRLGRLQGKKTYFWPSDDDALSELNRLFLSQADNDKGEPRVINLKGRQLKVPRQARGVAYFTFADLCAEQRSAVDYLELTKRYHAFVVEGIPVMDDARRDWALRFITLIDTLYDAGARLIASAAAPPEKLYHGDMHAAAFQRTISRLNEMQAHGYGA